MQRRLAILGLGLGLIGGCAAFGGDEYQVVEEQLGGATLDADQTELRYAVRACYVGVGDPFVEIELAPWIEHGDGEVAAVFESDPDEVYALTDRRPPVAPLLAGAAMSAACETGEIVRFTLDKPGAGKTATLAWVAVGRALGDEPGVIDGAVEVSLEPL